MDVAALGTVLVTSEDPDHPIDHAFDGRRGPGASRWISSEPGEQAVIVAFDAPQSIRNVLVEVDEPDVARTQELEVSLSTDGGRTYRHVLRQEYNFSPTGSTHEQERWSVVADGVTHVRLTITPDKGGTACRATLTTLALE
jgi:allantoicase